jgi:RNA polymerase sigma-70 factor (ECF subfamily)
LIDDEKIIGLFFERSEEAIRELDIKYGKICHQLSYNILGNQHDVEECVNDTYWGAWNTIPPTEPNPLQAFICKIARNISLKLYYKKIAAKRNSNYVIAMSELENSLSSPNTVEDEIEADELAGVIEAFIDTLSIENRVIFMRRYAYLDTYADIAKRVAITEKNVSVRLSRIRKQMKDYLIEREVYA